MAKYLVKRARALPNVVTASRKFPVIPSHGYGVLTLPDTETDKKWVVFSENHLKEIFLLVSHLLSQEVIFIFDKFSC